jgi:hypothetical protein
MSTGNLEDELTIVKMNSELRHAELELLSAHCATYKLRLHFSTEDLARHGHRDLLRKSVEIAGALNEYYTSIEKLVPTEEPSSKPSTGLNEQLTADLNESQMVYAIKCVSSFLRDQREQYRSSTTSLSQENQAFMSPFFSADLLQRVRMVELNGARISSPPFYEEARALGFVSLPEITHMNSLTFLDVLVFNERVTQRSLFHALVHAVQFGVLGLDRYTDLFVRSFVKTRFHFLVPLEAHAFFLESKFVRSSTDRFSVEEQVRLWVKQNRY